MISKPIRQLSLASFLAGTAMIVVSQAQAQSVTNAPESLVSPPPTAAVEPVSPGTNDTAEVTISLPEAGNTIELDESALREVAATGDLDAIDEEIRKLRDQDPNYQPPADIFRPAAAPVEDDGPQVDESYLWAAYDAGDFAAVRDEIGILQRLNPGWQPSEELTRLMDASETREYLKEATANEEWQEIVRYHKNNPGRFLCSDLTVEASWMAADAYANAGDEAGAYGIYNNLMETCDSTDLRLSTLQKALANRNDALLPALFELEEARGHSSNEDERFAQIKLDWKGDPAADAAARRRAAYGRLIDRVAGEEATPEDVNRLSEQVIANSDANGAVVLGWHYHEAEDFETAETWFVNAMKWSPDEKAAEGLASTYTNLGRLDEATQIAEAWQHRAEGMQQVMRNSQEQRVWSDIDAGRYSDALTTIAEMQTKAPLEPGLQLARGWALQGLDRPVEAAHQFRQILDKIRGNTVLEQQAAQGLALSYMQSGFSSEARGVIDSYPIPVERRGELERGLSQLEATIAFDRKDYRATLAAISEHRKRWPDQSNLAALEGWSLYNIGEFGKARNVFEQLYAEGHTREATTGIRATQSHIYAYDDPLR